MIKHSNCMDVNKVLMNKIDWEDVNGRLESLKMTSFLFLKQNLSE